MAEVSPTVVPRKRRDHTVWWVLGISAFLIGAIALVAMTNCASNAKIGTAKLKLNELHKALNLYKQQVGEFPDPDRGYLALLAPPDGHTPFLHGSNLPRDPWGELYLYQPTVGGPPRLASKGPDLREGTDDDIRLEDK